MSRASPYLPFSPSWMPRGVPTLKDVIRGGKRWGGTRSRGSAALVAITEPIRARAVPAIWYKSAPPKTPAHGLQIANTEFNTSAELRGFQCSLYVLPVNKFVLTEWKEVNERMFDIADGMGQTDIIFLFARQYLGNMSNKTWSDADLTQEALDADGIPFHYYIQTKMPKINPAKWELWHKGTANSSHGGHFLSHRKGETAWYDPYHYAQYPQSHGFCQTWAQLYLYKDNAGIKKTLPVSESLANHYHNVRTAIAFQKEQYLSPFCAPTLERLWGPAWSPAKTIGYFQFLEANANACMNNHEIISTVASCKQPLKGTDFVILK